MVEEMAAHDAEREKVIKLSRGELVAPPSPHKLPPRGDGPPSTPRCGFASATLHFQHPPSP